jgi:hypothetical protein
MRTLSDEDFEVDRALSGLLDQDMDRELSREPL